MNTQASKWIGGLLASALAAGSGAAHALDQGDVLLRVRAIDVIPDDSSSEIRPAAGGSVAGSGVGVNGDATLETDVSYMLTANLGLELIAATTRHTIKDNGVASGALGLSGNVIGVTAVLPPTLTLQYRFMPAGTLRPYLGAGVNYTVFYGEKSGIDGLTLKLGDSLGAAAQAGIDWDIDPRWFVNLDVKYIAMKTKATLSDAATGVAAYRTDVTLDPWVVGLGIGTTF